MLFSLESKLYASDHDSDSDSDSHSFASENQPLETVGCLYEHKNHRRFIEGVEGWESRKYTFFLGSVLTVVLFKHTPNCPEKNKKEKKNVCEQARPLSFELNLLSCSIVIMHCIC